MVSLPGVATVSKIEVEWVDKGFDGGYSPALGRLVERTSGTAATAVTAAVVVATVVATAVAFAVLLVNLVVFVVDHGSGGEGGWRRGKVLWGACMD